jgi:fructose-specific component phosphotransferase system IIB-like protein
MADSIPIQPGPVAKNDLILLTGKKPDNSQLFNGHKNVLKGIDRTFFYPSITFATSTVLARMSL